MNTLSRSLQRLVIGVIIVLLSTGCAKFFEEPIPNSLPTVPATALLVDIQAFPVGWRLEPCEPKDCIWTYYTRRTFARPGMPGYVVQELKLFNTVEGAQAEFRVREEADFRSPLKSNRPLLPPSGIAYRSPLADEYRFGCEVEIAPFCRAIFRYGKYFVEFFIDIDGGRGDGLKLKEVEPILRAMDEKAAEVLGIPLPTRTP